MKPLVSVIIPTCNRSRYVCEAVESALNQTYSPMEIIVVDDGSIDDTEAALNLYAGKIKYLKSEVSQGVSVARNIALRQAKGKYVAFLDDDDLWLEEKIDKDVKFLEVNADCGFVFCGLYYFSDSMADMGKRILSKFEEPKYEFLYDNCIIYSTSLVTMRKECLERVGLFDEGLVQSSDYDLWLRVARLFKFGYIDECLVKYRLHELNISRNLNRRIKMFKKIFNKPEIMEGKSWVQRRIRIAMIYYYVAAFFHKYRRYPKALIHYTVALIYCPYIGYYYWPSETENLRFTFMYRILKVYFLLPYCLFQSVFFPKKNIPSIALVDA